MKQIFINATCFINWASIYNIPINTIYVIRKLNFQKPSNTLYLIWSTMLLNKYYLKTKLKI